ncbi:MAG: hypothetical protein ACREO3_08540 [Arenimonas sp.]
MKRTLLALCLGLLAGQAFAGVAASGNGYDSPPLCPKAAAKTAGGAPVADAPAPHAPATVVRARGGGGATAATRLTSPRWHSLLPGMFR